MIKKITLPEHIGDITLGQYQRFDVLNKREDLDELGYNKRVIEIFTELKHREVGMIAHKDYEDILKTIIEAMNKEPEFKHRFKIGEVEFGFHNNLDEMTTAEFVDLKSYGVEVENFHKLMAILFRPITNKDALGNYELMSYEGTKKYADIMKRMPMNLVNGSLVFFSTLANELQNHIQKSTAQVLQKEMVQQITLKNGDGFLHSVN